MIDMGFISFNFWYKPMFWLLEWYGALKALIRLDITCYLTKFTCATVEFSSENANKIEVQSGKGGFGVFSALKRLVGTKKLSEEDLNPALEKMKEMLIGTLHLKTNAAFTAVRGETCATMLFYSNTFYYSISRLIYIYWSVILSFTQLCRIPNIGLKSCHIGLRTMTIS